MSGALIFAATVNLAGGGGGVWRLEYRFSEQPISTVGAAFGAKAIKLGKKSVTLGVWDTAGGERYESSTG